MEGNRRVRLKDGSEMGYLEADSVWRVLKALIEDDPHRGLRERELVGALRRACETGRPLDAADADDLRRLGLLGEDGAIPADVRHVALSSALNVDGEGWASITSPFADDAENLLTVSALAGGEDSRRRRAEEIARRRLNQLGRGGAGR